jgi:hypothetical protein
MTLDVKHVSTTSESEVVAIATTSEELDQCCERKF